MAAGLLPFVILSPSGTWDLAQYHLDRPLQLEATGAAYLLGLHALADIPVTVENSFGSQGLAGTGPAVIAGISTAILIAVLIAHRLDALAAAPPRPRHRATRACSSRPAASTMVALLVGGKVLSPAVPGLAAAGLLPRGRAATGRWPPG